VLLLRLCSGVVCGQLLSTVCKFLAQFRLRILAHGSKTLPSLREGCHVSLNVEHVVDSALQALEQAFRELSGSGAVARFIALNITDELLNKAPELGLLGTARTASSIQLGDESLKLAQVITLCLVRFLLVITAFQLIVVPFIG